VGEGLGELERGLGSVWFSYWIELVFI
jgi:hypothetical protein